MEHFEKSRLTPHFMYDAASGVVTGIYPRKTAVSSEHMHREFGASVQEKRKDLGYKVKDLTKWVQIHPNTLRAIESGTVSRIGGTELRQGHWLVQRLAEYLNTTPEILWPWHDDKERDEAW